MVEHVEAPSTQSRTPSLLPEQMSLAALNARSPSSSISPRSVNFATRALCVRATDAEWRTLFDHFVILARQIPGVVDVGTAFVAKYSSVLHLISNLCQAHLSLNARLWVLPF